MVGPRVGARIAVGDLRNDLVVVVDGGEGPPPGLTRAPRVRVSCRSTDRSLSKAGRLAATAWSGGPFRLGLVGGRSVFISLLLGQKPSPLQIPVRCVGFPSGCRVSAL